MTNVISTNLNVGSKAAIDSVPIKVGQIYLCTDGGLYYDKSETERILIAMVSYTKEEIDSFLTNSGGSGESTGESASKFQYTEMPEANTVAGLVQYIGETTETYTRGYFYLSDGTEEATWTQVNVQPVPSFEEVDLSGLNSKFQYTEMPEAVDVVGLVQYIGETTEAYTRGYFYYSDGVEWTRVNTQPDTEIPELKEYQYSEMPEANDTNEGTLVQYIGETNETYTRGYFYECVSDTETDEYGEDEITYSWVQVNTQPQPIIEDPDLSGLNNKFQYTEMPEATEHGSIVQYIGETTAEYIKGYFYRVKDVETINPEDESVSHEYSWVQVNTQPVPEDPDLSGLNNKFQYIEMPEANTVTGLYQYIGETTEDFIKGYFYYSDGTEEATWTQIDVQPQPEVDLSTANSKFQYTEMPEASVDYVNGLVQYIGETTEDFIKGYFYECVETSEVIPESGETVYSYSWNNVDLSKETDLSGVNSKFQYTEMPDPAEYTGIVQYVGITNETYTHGYFYEPLVLSETEATWSVVSIQPSDKAADTSTVYLTSPIAVTTDIGGIPAGTVFDASHNINDILSQLFHKYSPPNVTISIDPSATVYKNGAVIDKVTITVKTYKTVDPISTVTVTKTAAGSEPEVILEVTVDDDPLVVNNNTYTCEVTNVDSDVTFTVTVSDDKDSTSASKSIKFVYPTYWGVANSNAINESMLETFDSKLEVTNRNNISVTAKNQYVVYMTTTTVSSILDKNGFDNMDSFSLNTVLVDGVEYNCYVSSTVVTCTDFGYTFII